VRVCSRAELARHTFYKKIKKYKKNIKILKTLKNLNFISFYDSFVTKKYINKK